MKKADWQYLVDTLLFICIVGIALIGILLAFSIPKGPSALESSKYFLNLHRHQWGNIHLYLSLTFIILVIIHLTLDWKWITTRAEKIFKKGWKATLLATALTSIFVIFLFWLFYPKEPGAYEEYGRGTGREAGTVYSQDTNAAQHKDPVALDPSLITITGKMTLLDLEKTTRISVFRIKEALMLPSNISEKEPLGGLGKKHGFTIVELREVLTKLMNENEESYQKESEDVRRLSNKPASPLIHGRMEEDQEMTRGRMAEDQSGILITGQMSLCDIERRSGISAQNIIEKLGLPQTVSHQENIGRLRRRHGFTLQDVREVVASLMKKN